MSRQSWWIGFVMLVGCGHGSSSTPESTGTGTSVETVTTSEPTANEHQQATAPAAREQVQIDVVGVPDVSITVDGGSTSVASGAALSLSPGVHRITVAESRCSDALEATITVTAGMPPARLSPRLRTVPLTVRAHRWDRRPVTEPLVVLADNVMLSSSGTGPVEVPACARSIEIRTATLGGTYEVVNLDATTPLERNVTLAPGPSMVAFSTSVTFVMRHPQRREVRMPALHMDRSEVTVAQFRQCVNAGACRFDGPGPMPTGAELAACNWNVDGREEHPINCMIWEQARNFCRFAGKRLPSEDEWEYVARSTGSHFVAGTTEVHAHSSWPWVGDAPPTCDQGNIDGCGRTGTLPVCSLPAGDTEQGVCDVIGNVAELTSNCVNDSNYEPADYGPGEHIPTRFCNARGLGWSHPLPPELRHALLQPSGNHEPGWDRSNSFGFRCAREIER